MRPEAMMKFEKETQERATQEATAENPAVVMPAERALMSPSAVASEPNLTGSRIIIEPVKPMKKIPNMGVTRKTLDFDEPILKMIISFNYSLDGMPAIFSLMATNRRLSKLAKEIFNEPPTFIKPFPQDFPFDWKVAWKEQSTAARVKFLYDYNASLSRGSDLQWFYSVAQSYFEKYDSDLGLPGDIRSSLLYTGERIKDKKERSELYKVRADFYSITRHNISDHHNENMLWRSHVVRDHSFYETAYFARLHIFQNVPMSRMKYLSRFHLQALQLGLTLEQVENVSDQLTVAQLIKNHNKEAIFNRLKDSNHEQLQKIGEIKDLRDLPHHMGPLPNQCSEKCGEGCTKVPEIIFCNEPCGFLGICCFSTICVGPFCVLWTTDKVCCVNSLDYIADKCLCGESYCCYCECYDTDERAFVRWLKTLTPEHLFDGSPLQQMINEHVAKDKKMVETHGLTIEQSVTSIPSTATPPIIMETSLSATTTARPAILTQYNNLNVQASSVSIGISNISNIKEDMKMSRL